MKRTVHFLLVGLLAWILLLGLGGCGGAQSSSGSAKTGGGSEQPKTSTESPAKAPAAPAAPATKKPVNIILHVPAKSVNFLPFYVGEQKGIFEKHGFSLTVQAMKAEVGISALMAGEIQYSASSGTVLRAAMQDSPVRVVAYVVKDLTFQLYGLPEIKSIADLKGKAVGVTSVGGTDAYSARAIIKKGGLDPDKDITQVALGPTANIFAALEGKSIHAGILSPPFGPSAQQKGYVLLGNAADTLKSPQSGLATTTQRIKDNPEEVKGMIRATLESIRYTMDKKDEVVPIIMKEWKVDEQTASGSYDVVKKALSANGSIDEAVIKEEIKQSRETNKIDKEFTVEQVVDFTLLKAVQKELGM